MVGLLFDFVALLRREGPQAWVHQELKDIQDMRFRFAEEQDAMDTVTELASDLHRHPPKHTLLAQYLLSRWDPALVTPCWTRIERAWSGGKMRWRDVTACCGGVDFVKFIGKS